MKRIVLLLATFLMPTLVFAQSPVTGLPPFGSLSSGGFDTINNQNLNAYFAIPIVSSAGRGMPLNLSLSYNSLIWQPLNSTWTPVVDAIGNPTWGWGKDYPGGQARYKSVTTTIKCFPPGSPWFFTTKTTYSNFYYVDVLGTTHLFSISYIDDSNCSGNIIGTTAASAGDASGYYMDGSLPMSGQPPVVTSPGGIKSPGGTVTDAQGNFITKTVVSATETDWKDSVGNVALKIIYFPSQTSPTSIQYQFLDGTGASSYKTITLKLQAYNLKTIFGCSGIIEANTTAYLPYEMDIPSPGGANLVYTFTYEGTPGNAGFYTGRLLKVTLPTGGSYEYDYPQTAPYGINCADGTTINLRACNKTLARLASHP
jgi:hypothetical protein